MKIVFASFGGRYSDNPRAIAEALAARTASGDDREDGAIPVEALWVADPAHRAGFPAGTATVAAGSAAMVAALEAADVVVSNNHLDVEWERRAGTTYLQTWHGTPLKRLHDDVRWAPEGELVRLDRDVAKWDALLSQNHASTALFRRAFGWDGEVLESGYPRNDVLSSPRADGIRARVRARLGIDEGATVVLYAPTWRDDLARAGGGDVELHLDLDDVARRLGPDHVVLLRLHYLVAQRLAVGDRPGVLDVSAHPDISELYLASDVLVTDYSSAMFDFAVTGRPMVFFAHDLADYSDRLRGLYFDLEAIAPGPVVATSRAVVDALAELPALAGGHAGAYAAFRERFCHLDDGHATDRVLERFFPDRA